MRYFAVAVIAGIGAVNAQKSNFAKLFQSQDNTNPYGDAHSHFPGQAHVHLDRGEQCVAQVDDIEANTAGLETQCNTSGIALSTLAQSVGELQTFMTQMQLKGEENSSALAAMESQNMVQDADLARLTTDIANLENMERKLATAVLIFEMMGESMPSYDEYLEQVDALETTMTNNTKAKPVDEGLYGDVVADTAAITQLKDVDLVDMLERMVVLEDQDASNMEAMKSATDAADLMIGRVDTNDDLLNEKNNDYNQIESDFYSQKIMSDYFFTNDGDMQIQSNTAGYETLFEFCIQDGEVFEFYLNAAGELSGNTDVFSLYLADDSGMLVDNTHSAVDETQKTFELIYKGKGGNSDSNYKIMVNTGNQVQQDVRFKDRSLMWGLKTYGSEYDLTQGAPADKCSSR